MLKTHTDWQKTGSTLKDGYSVRNVLKLNPRKISTWIALGLHKDYTEKTHKPSKTLVSPLKRVAQKICQI